MNIKITEILSTGSEMTEVDFKGNKIGRTVKSETPKIVGYIVRIEDESDEEIHYYMCGPNRDAEDCLDAISDDWGHYE